MERTAEEVTEKYGLEAGLWKVFRSKDGEGKGKGIQAKDLLKRYGSAYLITSISLSLVSFGLCYVLVSSGERLGQLTVEQMALHSSPSLGIWRSCR